MRYLKPLWLVASQAEVLDTMVVGAIGVAGGIGLHEHSRW